MVNLVLVGRAVAWVLLGSDTVVVAASMIRDVDDLQSFGVPIMELLCHVLMVNLVHNYVKLVDLCEDAHLELAAPDAVLRYQSDVAVDWNVILDEVLVLLLVLLQEFDNFLTKSDVVELIAVQLICNCTEETVAISTCRFEPQVLL